jgi:hypothetical protein
MGDGASAHDLQRWRPEWKGVEPPLERLGVVLCSGHRADLDQSTARRLLLQACEDRTPGLPTGALRCRERRRIHEVASPRSVPTRWAAWPLVCLARLENDLCMGALAQASLRNTGAAECAVLLWPLPNDARVVNCHRKAARRAFEEAHVNLLEESSEFLLTRTTADRRRQVRVSISERALRPTCIKRKAPPGRQQGRRCGDEQGDRDGSDTTKLQRRRDDKTCHNARQREDVCDFRCVDGRENNDLRHDQRQRDQARQRAHKASGDRTSWSSAFHTQTLSRTPADSRRQARKFRRHSGALAHSRISILGTLSEHRASTSLRLLVHHDVERRPRRSGTQCAE